MSLSFCSRNILNDLCLMSGRLRDVARLRNRPSNRWIAERHAGMRATMDSIACGVRRKLSDIGLAACATLSVCATPIAIRFMNNVSARRTANVICGVARLSLPFGARGAYRGYGG
jgi:hypothetical protein